MPMYRVDELLRERVTQLLVEWLERQGASFSLTSWGYWRCMPLTLVTPEIEEYLRRNRKSVDAYLREREAQP